jgi:L-rhamnose-H+ transport protein
MAIVMTAGLLNAAFAIPMRYNVRWKWENTWLVFSVWSLAIFPSLLVLLIVRRPGELYASLSIRDILPALVFGFMWGIAQTTFGVSVKLLGVSVTLPIVTAISMVLGAFIPVLVRYPQALVGRIGVVLCSSAGLVVVGLLLYARAARMRERTSQTTNFTKGLILAIFTGATGGMNNVGFALSEGIVRRSELLGNSARASTYPVWAILLAAAFLPSLAYCTYMIRKNRTGAVFLAPGYSTEFLRSLAMAVAWILAMTLYGLSTTYMGRFGTSTGWLLYGSITVLFASVLGWKVGEWANATPQILRIFWAGMGLVLASVGVLGLTAY